MSIKICIDIDNVIAQTDEVIRAIIKDVTSGRVDYDYRDIRTYNYYECVDGAGAGLTRDEWRTVHHIFSGPDYLMKVEPFEGVQGHLRELGRAFEIHLATSRLHQARRGTIDWLERHGFPTPYDLHFLKSGEKHASLARFFAAVEDHYEQAVSFANAQTKCYLLLHPWNEGRPAIEGIHWVRDWPELTARLLRLEDAWAVG